MLNVEWGQVVIGSEAWDLPADIGRIIILLLVIFQLFIFSGFDYFKTT